MLKSYITNLWTQAWSMVFEDSAAPMATWLFRARRHTMRLTARRVATIVARVRLMAVLLAVVSPLWVLVDFWAFEHEIAETLALIRTLCAVAFAAVVVMAQGAHTLRDAYRALFFLFAVSASFYLFAYSYVLHLDDGVVVEGFSTGFALLPLVMLAGLALFPLTIAESTCMAVFIITVNFVGSGAYIAGAAWTGFVGQFWVLLLAGLIGILAGLSQLAYLIIVVREGLHDSLTGAYTRGPGEELLELQFTLSKRAGNSLAVALVEIDRCQELNDQFGYAAGDAMLVGVTQKINDSMRAGDMLIRWTGKQFLLVFPCAAATADAAAGVLGRLLSSGLGTRPDGQPLTASIGLAERVRDAAEDWWRLVDLAESCMSKAQRAGGNRTIEPEAIPQAVPEPFVSA